MLPIALPLQCFWVLVPGINRSARETAKAAGSGGFPGATWYPGKQNGNVEAKAEQALPGWPMLPGH